MKPVINPFKTCSATRSRVCALALGVSALSLGACTQQAAQVSLRGQEHFSRGAVNVAAHQPVSHYSSYAPAAGGTTMNTTTAYDNAPTSSAARIDSIGVSDLPPPSAAKGTSVPKLTQDAPLKSVKPGANASGFIWPVEGKVISRFGPQGGGKANDGITIAAPNGEPVYAAAKGEVVYEGDKLKGYGRMVILRHNGNKFTTYAHLSRAAVDRYDQVKQGDLIGYVGSTGGVKEPQLHFAIRENTDAVNPEKYLPRRVAGL